MNSPGPSTLLPLIVLKENREDDHRVAVAPKSIPSLLKEGFAIKVEHGAGEAAGFTDEAYQEAGASIASGPEEALSAKGIFLRVNAPTVEEAGKLPEESVLVCNLLPHQQEELMKALAQRNITCLAMNLVPRITRAQKLDSLSAMANIAGYRAVISAAGQFGGFFSGQMTAAGRLAPAKILVIGAGVAGLSALAAGSGLGAVVRAFDTRPSVKEQVESLGGEFLEVDIDESGEGSGGYAKEVSEAFQKAEEELFLKQASEVDIVITTALIPGKPAPKLWTAEMVKAMKPGSVIVDLASPQGGNCELTVPGEVKEINGVRIIGWTNFTNQMAGVASELYGNTIWRLLQHLGGAEKFNISLEDEIARPMAVTHGGKVTWPPPQPTTPTPQPAPPEKKESAQPAASQPPPGKPAKKTKPSTVQWVFWVGAAFLCALSLVLKFTMEDTTGSTQALQMLVQRSIVFVLACFVGWHIIWNVTAALHTPLMSVTNAISGIIIIGGLLYGARLPFTLPVILGMVAMFLAIINVSGGFLVTYRMLKMFRKQE